METKPFSLQSPEQIAKDYGGNKQKIAEAMQMGVIDPTAGTLAAMFIDRMRNAAQMEAAPQQSVAQQVFAPPTPQMPQGAPAGLAATPQAAAMPPMPGGAPSMASPPPMEQPMPGMAMGGLTTLPVPDDMFDEPTNGGFNDGYRGGGLVAFAQGDLVEDEEEPPIRPLITVVGQRPEPPEVVNEPPGPIEYYGFFRDPFLMKDRIAELSPQTTERRKQFDKYLEKMLDPAEQKRRRQEDMWLTLGEIGARMATTPGSLLQAASTGIAEALPGVRAAAATRRGEEREAISELAKNEGLTNAEAREMYKLIQAGTDSYGRFNEARLTREQQDQLARYQEQQANYRTIVSGRYSLAGANAAADAARYGSDVQLRATIAQVGAQKEAAFGGFLNSAPGITSYNKMVAGGMAPDEALTMLRNRFFGGTPSPPPGAVIDR